jgi:dolichol-phosphate mannosyltransferase
MFTLAGFEGRSRAFAGTADLASIEPSQQRRALSVLIPFYNEEGNIQPLVDEVHAALNGVDYEIVCVNDCSGDATAAELIAAQAASPDRIKILTHTRRRGKSAALFTGLRHCAGDWVQLLDGDGQNDPADIPRLLARLGEPGGDGPALVGGVRTNRQAEGSKRFASVAANWIRDAVLRDGCPDTGCGLKVYWREAYVRLPWFASQHRYMPALFQTYGLACAYEPVNDRARTVGVSKYNNLRRALVGLYDLIGVSWLRHRTVVPKVVERAG